MKLLRLLVVALAALCLGGQGMGPGPGVGTTSGCSAATWNPADKGANVTLSGGNLSASISGANSDGVRSTVGKSSGKWYWEITATSAGVAIGIVVASASNTTWFGANANGWLYYGFNGQRYNNNVGAAFGATFTTNDVIGFALDVDAGTLQVFKNNVSQGTMTGIAAGTYYAAFSNDSNGGARSNTANFGATALTYSPPSGYTAGLCN